MRVRKAEPADIPWLIAQLREFAALHPIGPRVMGSDDHCEALLAELLKTQYVAIADDDGTPIGLIAGAVSPHPFAPELLVATELWWFIAPAQRGGKAGLMLLEAYEQWVKDSGAHVSNFTLETNSPVNPRTLAKRGYQIAEHQYARWVQ